MALRLREDEAFLAARAEQEKTTDITALQQQPEALRLRVLTSLLEGWGVPEPEAEHIGLADKLVFSDRPSAKADFPGGVTVSRRYNNLEKAEQGSPIPVTVLPCPGTVELPQCGIRVLCKPAQAVYAEKDHFTVAFQGQPVIRSRQSGDKLRRSGGTKSLKALFIDGKIPASQRDRIPILADEKGVVAVFGFGPHTDRLAESLPAVEIRFEQI